MFGYIRHKGGFMKKLSPLLVLSIVLCLSVFAPSALAQYAYPYDQYQSYDPYSRPYEEYYYPNDGYYFPYDEYDYYPEFYYPGFYGGFGSPRGERSERFGGGERGGHLEHGEHGERGEHGGR
jgi:hypothetical protein